MDSLPIAIVQLAHDVRDACCEEARRTALLRLREACGECLVWLDRTPDDTATGVPHVNRECVGTPSEQPKLRSWPGGPDDDDFVSRWQSLADEYGEPLLVLRSEFSHIDGVRPCIEYVVGESGADRWERENALGRVEPR